MKTQQKKTIDMTRCSLCGQDIYTIAGRGAYLERVSPKGGPFVGECRPSCDRKHGSQDDALIAAIGDTNDRPRKS